MLQNYFLIAWRNLLRHKGYAFINILGLTVGLAANVFILLWVTDELSFDRFHANGDRIFQMLVNSEYPDGSIETYGATPAKLKAVIESQIPEVELATQYSMETELLVKHESNAFNESGIYADPALFEVFSFPIVRGNASQPLADIQSIAISENLAKKLFEKEDPIGKTLRLGESSELMVTSVFENIPQNSTLQFDFVVPFELFVRENPWTQHWKSGGSKTAVMLKSADSRDAANRKLAGLIKSNCADCSTTPLLFPYLKSRLYSEFENGKNVGGRIQQVFLFGAVAILILVMACINFMNLSTARSANRSREVGVRKSIGARKSDLVIQFMTESVLLSFIAMLFAMGIVQMLLPFFNDITAKSIELDFANPVLTFGILGVALVCGLLAGSYPAFILAAFHPAKVLKGNTQAGLTGNTLRKTLVVVQFTTSLILIIGSITVYKQIVFIGERNLGFDKENIIVVDRNEGTDKNYSAIKNDLNQLAAVKSIAFGGNNIFTVPITTTDPVWAGKPDNSSITFKIYRCDAEFIPTMNIRMQGGRNFIGDQDASNYIINKKAAEVMGLDLEHAIGADLEMWNGKGKVVGVTDDFHNNNLRFGIEPMIFMYSENIGSHYFIKLGGQGSVAETIAQVQNVFEQHNPDYPFEYTFLDEVFDREYRTEAVVGKLSLSFTVIAILISCLGLVGLASFTAERRTRELGIRKVMGASVWGLVVMLGNDFVALFSFSLFAGIPIAWYLVNEYLSDYAFRTEISWSTYLSTSLFMLIVTLLSVGYQSVKAASANPVDSLRNE
ncbi:ABC transporter permease [uncultured Imperialibacter sp.]|uniref:ABC transporter permease n=1 Tax=uncultured Imperialibacter sp. TaxID=1672639 RepID=UPI0030DCD1B8|tara:strand:- start:10272 stop:12629 length:2358 start_codon:yes stop_codon:yes gene_type:complete